MPPTLSLTSVKQAHDNLSTHKVLIYDYTGPAAYVSGGDPLAPSDVGWGNFDFIDLGTAWNGSAVRLLAWDKTNNKIVWYVPNTGSEASGDLSGYSARIMLIGQG